MLAPPYSSETLLVENEECHVYRQFSLSYTSARGKAPRAAANKGAALRRNQAGSAQHETSSASVCKTSVASSITSSAHLGTHVCHGGQISTFANRVKALSVHPLLTRRSCDDAAYSPKQPVSVPSSALYRKPQFTVCTIGSAKCKVSPLPPQSLDPTNTDVLSGCLLDDDDADSCSTTVPPSADCLHKSVHEELRAAQTVHSAVASTHWQFNLVPEAVVDSAIVSPCVSPETHKDPAEMSPTRHSSPVTCTVKAGQEFAEGHVAHHKRHKWRDDAAAGPRGYVHVHSNPAAFQEPSCNSPVRSLHCGEILRPPLKYMVRSGCDEALARTDRHVHSQQGSLQHSVVPPAVTTGSHITASPPRTHRSHAAPPDTSTTHTGRVRHTQVESEAAFTAISRAGSCATPADSSLACMCSPVATQHMHNRRHTDYSCLNGARWQSPPAKRATHAAIEDHLGLPCLQHGYRGAAASTIHSRCDERASHARRDSLGDTNELDSPNPRSHSSPRVSNTEGFTHPHRSYDPFLDEGITQGTTRSTAAMPIPEASSTYLDAASRDLDAVASYGSVEAGQPVFGTFANVPSPPSRPVRSVFPSGGYLGAQRNDQEVRRAGWPPHPDPMPRPLVPESDVLFSPSTASGHPMQGMSYDRGRVDGHLPSEMSDASCAPTELANTVWCFCGGGDTIFGSACGCGGRASFASGSDSSLFGVDNGSRLWPCTCPCHQAPAAGPIAADGTLWECDCNCADLTDPVCADKTRLVLPHAAHALCRGGNEDHHHRQRYWHADEFACGDVEDSQSLSQALSHVASMHDMNLSAATPKAVPYTPNASPPCADVGLCSVQATLASMPTAARRASLHQRRSEGCRSREANALPAPASNNSAPAAQARFGPFFSRTPGTIRACM